MSIFKNVLKIKYFAFFLLINLVQSFVIAQVYVSDTLSYNRSVLDGLDAPKPELPENPGFDLIEKEINNLKGQFPGNYINLDISSKDLAPNLYNQLNLILDELVRKSGVERPKISIYVGDKSDTYNASIKMFCSLAEKTITTTLNGVVSKVEKDFDKTVSGSLILGEALLKVIFWNNNYKYLLSAVIAHELGHLKSEHFNETDMENEYEADCLAIKFVGRNNKLELIRVISLVELAGQMHNTIISRLDFSLSDIEKVIRIVSNNIVDKMPMLGQLGQSTSHVKFAATVSAAVEKTIMDLGESILTSIVRFADKLSENIEIACTDQNKLFDGALEEVILKCEELEVGVNRLYSPTHPVPVDRINYIKCL